MRRLTLILLLAACVEKDHRFTEPLTLHVHVDADGNDLPNTAETFTAKQLTDGRSVYVQNCLACHGDHGDGRGPSAFTMRPPPRNFVQG